MFSSEITLDREECVEGIKKYTKPYTNYEDIFKMAFGPKAPIKGIDDLDLQELNILYHAFFKKSADYKNIQDAIASLFIMYIFGCLVIFGCICYGLYLISKI